MKQNTIFIAVLLLMYAACIQAKPKAGHYDAINNMSGQALWDSIYSCTQKGYTDLTYKGLFTAYEKTDTDEDNNIIDMYGGCVFPLTKKCGSYNKECDCYNREHSIPKSWWGTPKESKQGSDIFHLVPTDGKVNGMRGNLAFGEVKDGTSDYTYNQNYRGTSDLQGYDGTVFEPRDEYKGDFARGYMGTMAKWNLKATLDAGSSTFTGEYTEDGNFGLTEYGMFLLMKWHRQDPVSEKELKRNDAIEETQGNRNPFIDYPELAEYIWGNKKGQTVRLTELHSAYGDEPYVEIPVLYAPLDSSIVYTDSACVGDTVTLCIRAEGDFMPDMQLSIMGDDANMFSVSPTSLTSQQLSEGHDVCIIYTPTEQGTHNATLVFSNGVGLKNVEVFIQSTTKQSCQYTIPDTLNNAVNDIYYDDYYLEVTNDNLHFISATCKDFVLYDIFGRTIAQQHTAQFNINLNKGLYVAYINRKAHKILVK